MKILKENYVKDATITGEEETQYPLVNMYSKYMEQTWKPGIGNGLIATIDFGEEKSINGVVFGYTDAEYSESNTLTITPGHDNTITVQPLLDNTITISGEVSIAWVLKNTSGDVQASGTVCVDDEICFDTSFSTVSARYMEISAKGQDTDIYIGGVGAGEYFLDGVQANNATISLDPINNAGRTDEGFVTGRDDFALRQWEMTLDCITPETKKTIETLIRTYGAATPFYSCELDKNEPAIHGTFTRIGQFRRDTTNNLYSMGLTILEAR